jgi:hypothetical protein
MIPNCKEDFMSILFIAIASICSAAALLIWVDLTLNRDIEDEGGAP